MAEILFHDGFESGDMSTSNADGFSWLHMNRTSLVTMNPGTYGTCDGTQSGPHVIFNGNPVCIGVSPDRDWTAKNGDISMRFRYPAGEPMSEQRFSLGVHYEDIWVKYWIRVPVNFNHGSLNNKFLSLWVGSGGYDTYGTVTWQTRPDGSGGARLVYQDGGVLSGERGATAFISYPSDQGRWMEVVARVKAATSSSAEDGIIQFYRRWDGDIEWEKIHEKLNANTWNPASGSQGISHGYLMGWANGAYTENTEFLLNDFKLSESSLLDAGAPPPMSPENLKIIVN